MTKNYTENLFVGLCASDKNGGPTQMASQLADSLEQKDGFDIEDIGKRYLNWHRRDGYDAGPTANRVFQLVSRGMSLTKASEQVDYELSGRTAGCNPAHRAAPLAMLDVSDKELIDITIQEAKLTHWHPLAADVSVATVLLCRKLWRGEDWHTAVANTRKGRLIETQRALETHKMDELNGNGYAPNVLAAAMYFLSNSKSITEAIECSIDFAGPANYCPVLVGTIGAAKWSNN
jgi:ADP-ribosylglycohydrolase